VQILSLDPESDSGIWNINKYVKDREDGAEDASWIRQQELEKNRLNKWIDMNYQKTLKKRYLPKQRQQVANADYNSQSSELQILKIPDSQRQLEQADHLLNRYTPRFSEWSTR